GRQKKYSANPTERGGLCCEPGPKAVDGDAEEHSRPGESRHQRVYCGAAVSSQVPNGGIDRNADEEVELGASAEEYRRRTEDSGEYDEQGQPQGLEQVCGVQDAGT